MNSLKFIGKDVSYTSGNPTLLCGIINVTPDSFSDGGKWYGVEKAVNRAKELISQGADMLDIGGESTRPGSHYIEVQSEIERVVPVIKAIREFSDIVISVDTWKSEVADSALQAGANIVNDITGFLGDKDMAKVVAKNNAGAIIMFNPVIARPDHPGSKIFPTFGENPFTEEEHTSFLDMDIIELMENFFNKSLERAFDAGLDRENIMLDPGIGFGFTARENLMMIDQMDIIHKWGYFIYLGVSRKRFITNIVEDLNIKVDLSSDEGINILDSASANLTAIASYKGVEAIRIHTIEDHKIAAAIGNSVSMAENIEDKNLKQYKRSKND